MNTCHICNHWAGEMYIIKDKLMCKDCYNLHFNNKPILAKYLYEIVLSEEVTSKQMAYCRITDYNTEKFFIKYKDIKGETITKWVDKNSISFKKDEI